MSSTCQSFFLSLFETYMFNQVSVQLFLIIQYSLEVLTGIINNFLCLFFLCVFFLFLCCCFFFCFVVFCFFFVSFLRTLGLVGLFVLHF